MGAELFCKHARIIIEHYPSFQLILTETEPYLEGSLPVYDNEDNLAITYHIKIRSTKAYPFRFPKVYECGNAFPHNADWHINTDDTCCLTTKIKEVLFCGNGLDPLKFMEEVVLSFFANQWYRRNEGFYLYGEYGHGINGTLESYGELLGGSNKVEVLSRVYRLLNIEGLVRTQSCPICGADKVRKCHLKTIQELLKHRSQIEHDLRSFLNAYPLDCVLAR